MSRALVVVSALVVPLALSGAALQSSTADKQPIAPDQWSNYAHDSHYSPLTQITAENVSQLIHAWTFTYGAGSVPSHSFLGLDYRFQVLRQCRRGVPVPAWACDVR